MTYYRYDEVSSYAQKSGPCVKCGKRTTRKRKFTNTVNPWNKNPDGTVRTRIEVQDNVNRLAREWQLEPVMHAGCEATS
jgi:hypothetical protein